MKTSLLFLAILAGISVRVFAQKPEMVTIDLNIASVKNAALPFDVPFVLTGKAPDNCNQIKFSYRVSKKCLDKKSSAKNWITLPVASPNGTDYTPSSTWTKQNGETTFYLDCSGVHPDMTYDFEFELFKEVTDENIKNDLKQKLAARIALFAVTFAGRSYDGADETALNAALQAIIVNKLVTNPKQHLRQRADNSQEYAVDIKSEMSTYFSNLAADNNTIANRNRNIFGNGNMLKFAIDELNANKAQVILDIDKVLGADPKLTDNSKALMDQPVSPMIEAYKMLTLRNGLQVLRKLCQAPQKLEDILRGTAQLTNSDIVATTVLSPQSTAFLRDVIGGIKDGQIATTETSNNVKFQNLNDLYTWLVSLSKNIQELADAKAHIPSLTASFPDITAGIIISEALSAETVSVSDISTDKTNYISAEGGIGYAPAFQSMFSYFGANFYFLPVNKKAKLDSFKGWNKWGKILSLSVGYTTLYSDRLKYTYSILGNETKSDVFLGLGIRLNRVLKLTIAAVPYKIQDNPLSDDRRVGVGIIGGIGFDVNLLGALGGVAKGLKLTSP